MKGNEVNYVKRLEQANKVLVAATLEYLIVNDIDLKKSEMKLILDKYVQYSDNAKSTILINPIDYFVRDVVKLYPTKNHVIFKNTLAKLCLTLNNAYEVVKAEELRKDMSKWIDPDDINKHINDQYNNRDNGSSDDKGNDGNDGDDNDDEGDDSGRDKGLQL